MTDAERVPAAPLVPSRPGERLRAAREARGLSLDEVASRTRVPLRHLEALEAGDYSGLPSGTYAVGFARAYARAIGEPEPPVAKAVRDEVARYGRPTPEYEPYATADPARVPSRWLTFGALGLAIGLAVLAVLWFGASWWRASRDAPQETPIADAPPSVEAPGAGATPAVGATTAQTPTGGQVRLVATDEVWLRVYDAANTTLFIGTLKPGDGFDVPADANNPMINVGRPDKLQVTLNGSAIPPLGTGERPIKDVPVSGAAIAARLSGSPAPAASPSAAAATPAPAASASVPPFFADRPAPRASTAPARRRTPDESETARANRSSARAAARGVEPPVP
jgi:cytoskeleton protein RodZ